MHALLSPKHLNVEALYAAPFHNKPAQLTPKDGMEKSYDEILRLLDFLNVPAEDFVYRGSRAFLSDKETPVPSDAATDMIERAMTSDTDNPLYVVAVGAITNVASANLNRTRNYQPHCHHLARRESTVLAPHPRVQPYAGPL